jgi:hypothetical protein
MTLALLKYGQVNLEKDKPTTQATGTSAGTAPQLFGVTDAR